MDVGLAQYSDIVQKKEEPPKRKGSKTQKLFEDSITPYIESSSSNESHRSKVSYSEEPTLEPKDEKSDNALPSEENPQTDASHQQEKHKFEIDFSDLTIKNKRGEGAFGAVYKAELWGSEVAVKQFTNLQQDSLSSFFHEIAILKTLRHVNCVLLLCYSKDPLCIVFEYLNQGSLYDLLHISQHRITHDQIMKVAIGAAQGIHYLHSKNILHKDIKSQNVLIGDNWTKIKVCDFGLSILGKSAETSKYVGSVQWRAPEASSLYYTAKSDVYSYGIMLWECVTRQTPFYGMTVSEIVKTVRDGIRPPIPSYCPPQFKELIEKCWHTDPDQRPTFAYIIEKLTSYDMSGTVGLGEEFSEVSNLLEREGQSLHFMLPIVNEMVASTPRYARMYSSVLWSEHCDTAVDFYRKRVFARSDRWWENSFFLVGDYGNHHAGFIFDTMEQLKAGDSQLVKNRPIFVRVSSYCAVPIMRELMEIVALEVHGSVSFALLESFKIPVGKGEDYVHIYKRDVIPLMRTIGGWRGSIICTDYNTGRVMVQILFENNEAIQEFKDKNIIPKEATFFRGLWQNTPTFEQFSVDSAQFGGVNVKSCVYPDQEPWFGDDASGL